MLAGYAHTGPCFHSPSRAGRSPAFTRQQTKAAVTERSALLPGGPPGADAARGAGVIGVVLLAAAGGLVLAIATVLAVHTVRCVRQEPAGVPAASSAGAGPRCRTRIRTVLGPTRCGCPSRTVDDDRPGRRCSALNRPGGGGAAARRSALASSGRRSAGRRGDAPGLVEGGGTVPRCRSVAEGTRPRQSHGTGGERKTGRGQSKWHDVNGTIR